MLIPHEDAGSPREDRADRYRQVPGLIEKIYLRFRQTGELGAVYLWESEEALDRFRESELARSIPDAYQVEGTAKMELADVALVVRPERDRRDRLEAQPPRSGMLEPSK